MSRSKSKHKKPGLPQAANLAPAETAVPDVASSDVAPEEVAPVAPELAPQDAASVVVASAPLPVTAPAPRPTASDNIAEAAGVLTIDLGAIADNWRYLSRHLTPVDCAAVVKADAYGCGIEQVVPALRRAGCTTFFVANLAEARRVRPVAPDAVVYVLGGVPPGTAKGFADCHARPVINSLTEFAEWDAFVTANNWQGGAALHVDTGMNRLGLPPDEAAAFGPRIQQENHGITLLMSHLACAETPHHPLNEQQIRAFREVRMQFRGVPASLANSSGIFLGPSAHCDLARPGVALYGANPTPAAKNPMRPVVEMQARVAQIRRVNKGDTVGYNASWTAKRPSRIAVATVGYADGYLRAASAPDGKTGGKAIVAGATCPIVGQISMDLMAVDITDVPEASIRRGDLIGLIGGALDINAVASAAGTIAYEILTSLGRRHHRVYKGG
jgi:alanine racemase